MKVITLIAVLFTMVLLPATVSSEEFTQGDAEQMVFDSLSEEEQQVVARQLQDLADESVGRAEEMIREDGGLVPFAYLGDYEGGGQFAWFNHEEPVPPEVAAQAIQRAIVQGAFNGNLVASILYMTSAAPEGLDEAAREKLGDEVRDDLSLEEMRFLIIEMQHLAGLGILKVIPYWQEDGEWVFGPSQEQMVNPELHKLVRQTFQKASQQQNLQAE